MKASRMTLPAAIGLVLGVSTGLGAQTVRIEEVDCTDPDPTKHGSIAKALEKPADQLIIEISGICEEDVQVRRGHVTLRGSDPLVDGIRPAPNEPIDRALELFDVQFVTVEKLKLTGSRFGLTMHNTVGIAVIDCRLEDNLIGGLIVASGSGSIDLIDTVVTGNGNLPILVTNGSALRCTRCKVEDNGGFARGVLLSVGSELRLSDSTLEGFSAIDASGGSRVFSGVSSIINGLPWALRAQGTVSVELSAASINGGLDLRQGSVVKLFGATHTNPGGPSAIQSGSSFVLDPGSSVGGDFDLTELSQAVFPAGAITSGSLSCRLGADAFCDDPVGSIGGTSDCGRCPKP